MKKSAPTKVCSTEQIPCEAERAEKILEQREVYRLQTVDHGYVVKREGDRPTGIAKSGILRIGSHSKYGFGELRVKPVEPRSNQCQEVGKNSELAV